MRDASFKIISLVLGFFLYAVTVNAYVASSTNYRIDSDAVAVGGNLSTSTSYSLQSSLSAISSETSTSTSFSILSGYLQMVTPYLAVSSPGNVTMSPAIYTSGGGQGNGSASWSVTTDSSGGYSLSIKSSTNPALVSSSGVSFSNYSPRSGGIPSYSWSVGDAEDAFGFSPEGADITTSYKDDGTACNVSSGGDTSDKCWDFIDTSTKIIAQKSSSNHPSGSSTRVKFRAEAGRSVHKPAGNYSATITITVLPL